MNANGTTALMAAAGVEMFNPNEDSGTDADGFAALQLAVALGAGDINAVNKNGDTALHGAVFRATTDAITFLVERGARLDVKNKPQKCEQYSAGCITEPGGLYPVRARRSEASACWAATARKRPRCCAR